MAYFPYALPTRYIVKLASLNKYFRDKILDYFAPFTIKDLRKYSDTVQFARILDRSPFPRAI